MKRNNLQLEIVAEYLERVGRQRHTFYTVKNKYGLCRIRKDKYLSGQCPTIRSALDKDSYFKKMLYEKHKKTITCIEPYINDSTKLKFQCEYGHIFSKLPNEALRAVICPCCFGYHKTTREVVEMLEKKYSNYTYSNFFYFGTKYKSFVDCKDHGVFLTSVAGLLNNSSGCPECAKISSGFTLTSFKNACNKNNNGIGIFYILRCFNENEEFYKIGVTSKSIKIRYAGKYAMPYTYEIVQEIKDESVNIFKLERFLKKYITSLSFRYTPDIIFSGSLTECFKIN